MRYTTFIYIFFLFGSYVCQKKFANFNPNADDDDDDGDGDGDGEGNDVDDGSEGCYDGDNDDRNTNNFAVRANYIKLSCSAHSGQVCH